MPVHNRLLARLLALEPALARAVADVECSSGHEHMRPSSAPTYALFPAGGVLSILLRTPGGSQAEVSAVGVEGFVGLSTLLGMKRNPFLILQQVPGTIQRVPLHALAGVMKSNRDARALIDRYGQYQLMSANQLTMCTAVHPARARAARWILTTGDRADSNTYRLTQELLAQMLGSSRQALNAIATGFKDAGLIDYHRGEMHLLQRARLQREACECYGVLRRMYTEAVPGGRRGQ